MDAVSAVFATTLKPSTAAIVRARAITTSSLTEAHTALSHTTVTSECELLSQGMKEAHQAVKMNCPPLVGLRNQLPTSGEQLYAYT